MYVVIFRAQVRALDAQYQQMAARMRELALNEFGCLAFHAVSEGDQEVALSYWPSEQAILAWKAHPEHGLAQAAGRTAGIVATRWKWPRSAGIISTAALTKKPVNNSPVRPPASEGAAQAQDQSSCISMVLCTGWPTPPLNFARPPLHPPKKTSYYFDNRK